jgi:chondroitin 4-sulfotransferase 11
MTICCTTNINWVFIHINKTGGSSIHSALGFNSFHHKTCLEHMAEIDEETWKASFKFTFVRNPWDRAVSQFHWRMKTNQSNMGKKKISFSEWLVQTFVSRNPSFYDNQKMFLPQVDWISDQSGDIAIDFIGRFETIEKDFQHVCRKLGINANLPHLKRTERHHYRFFYDELTKNIIRKTFQRDIAHFNYSF